MCSCNAVENSDLGIMRGEVNTDQRKTSSEHHSMNHTMDHSMKSDVKFKSRRLTDLRRRYKPQPSLWRELMSWKAFIANELTLKTREYERRQRELERREESYKEAEEFLRKGEKSNWPSETNSDSNSSDFNMDDYIQCNLDDYKRCDMNEFVFKQNPASTEPSIHGEDSSTDDSSTSQYASECVSDEFADLLSDIYWSI
jgi:hypothetical protein